MSPLQRLFALWLCVTALLGAAAHAQEVLLITTDAPPRTGRLLAIDSRSITLREGDAPATTIPRAQCVGLLALASIPPASDPVRIELADGQVLVGPPGSLRGTADDVRFTHRIFGEITLAMEQVRTLSLRPDTSLPPAAASDVLLLVNGDRLEGLLTRWSDPLQLQPQAVAGQPEPPVIDIPLDRLAAASLITPERAPALPRVWINDGSALDIGHVQLDDDGLVRLREIALLNSDQLYTTDVDHVRGVLFAPGSCAALAGIEPRRVEGPTYRLRTPPPGAIDPRAPLGASDIDFSGPVAIDYELPRGWVSGILSADVELPPSGRTWGDCELIVSADGRELARHRLSGETPTASLFLTLPARRFTIEITEGRAGAVQDTVRLRRPLLLKPLTQP